MLWKQVPFHCNSHQTFELIFIVQNNKKKEEKEKNAGKQRHMADFISF